MSIRVGLIGAGRIGQAHLDSLAALDGVQVAAVCDSDRTLAEQAAEPFGAGVHINFRTMIEAERLDALFVCTPAFAQGDPEMLAARAGIHLFVSGPVGVSVEKARQVRTEIETAGVVSSVASPWRYLSGTDRVREILQGKKIALIRGWHFGPIPAEGWRSRRESSGGFFVQEAIDLVDLALYLAGDAMTVTALSFEGIVAERLPSHDIEDALTALMRFRSGTIGTISAADLGPHHESVLTVLADGIEMRITPTHLDVVEAERRTTTRHSGSALQAAQVAFLEAVESGKTDRVRCNYASAVRTLEVALAAAESAQTGKQVEL